MKAPYRRVMLKLSGEVLAGDGEFGISPVVFRSLAEQMREVHALGTEIGIVIGGGNIIRGITAASQGMERAAADYVGMLASVMNGVALQDALEAFDLHTRVLTAIEIRASARNVASHRVAERAGSSTRPTPRWSLPCARRQQPKRRWQTQWQPRAAFRGAKKPRHAASRLATLPCGSPTRTW